MHCIIDAMLGRGRDVCLMMPVIDSVPDVVLADVDRVRGILLNLYTNAAKFTKSGYIALRVSITGKDYRPVPHESRAFISFPAKASSCLN